MKTLKLIGPIEYKRNFLLSDTMSLNREIQKLSQRVHHIQNQLDYQTKKIRINKSGSVHFILISDVIYCQADSNYCIINLKNGEKFISSKTLKKVEGMIYHPMFLRIHQSFLVNSEYVRSFEKSSTRKVVLVNGEVLPVSRSFNGKCLMKDNSTTYQINLK